MGSVGRVLTMKIESTPKSGRRKIVSLLLIALGFGVVAALIRHVRPATDDATIDADVVHIAAAVGGRILKLPVHENQLVRRGDVLLQIDPVPYQLSVNLAEANLAVAQAALETQHRIVATQRSNAVIAGEQAHRAETNLGLSARTEERLAPLSEKGYVPRQQLDQAQVARRDATTSVLQAREQANAARRAIDTVDGAQAAVQVASAALANARRALDDTLVRAPHDGRIAGLAITSGETVAPGQSVFTLIATEEWFAVANLRETELQAVTLGDCATVYSMIDAGKALKGKVDSIGWGVLDGDRINLPRSVPYVQPSLNWVRVAHRFPVRIRLEEPPEALMRMGASASVEVGHGAACR